MVMPVILRPGYVVLFTHNLKRPALSKAVEPNPTPEQDGVGVTVGVLVGGTVFVTVGDVVGVGVSVAVLVGVAVA